MVTALSLLTACGGNPKTTAEAEKIDYTVEQFADLQILSLLSTISNVLCRISVRLKI